MSNYDVLVIGAGVSGATFACKTSKFAKTLLIEANEKGNIPMTTNVFPEHNRPFIKEIDWQDKSIFPCFHIKTNYLGYNEDGIIDSEEFGAPLGNISHTEKLIEILLQKFENQGGIIKNGEKVTQISRKSDHIEINTNRGQLYSGKVLAIATGSHSFDLQRSLGFGIPDSYNAIFTHFYGDEDLLHENIPYNYVYHINPKISNNGPFFINKAKRRILVGFLGNTGETIEQMASKLNRILNNYKRIQPFIQGLKRDLKTINTKISKHVIKKLVQDRVLILGEAGGLCTDFFYEGLLCGVSSADIASKTIKPLLEKDSNFNSYELIKYEQELKRILLNKYFKNGTASEYLFYSVKGPNLKILWDTYAKLIRTNKRLRREIWEAYRMQDLENYDLSGTRWAGEELFKMLPTLTKISLGTKFFRALFK